MVGEALRRAIVVAMALAVAACAINPVSGRPEVTLVSREQERRIGAEEAERIEETIGLVRDHQAAAYVAAVGARLAARAPDRDTDYRFYVVDMVEPNAFGLPGGFVYVSRGLLPLLESEDELAGVLGHEVGHVAARHATQRISAAVPLAVPTVLGAAAVGVVAPGLGRAVADIGGLTGQILLQPYGRRQEREADQVGQRLAAAGGWDPAALSTFLRTLARDEALRTGTVRSSSFLASHPSTPERVRDTEANARGLTRAAPNPVAAARADMLQRLDGLVVGPDPAGGVVVDGRFLQPDLEIVLEVPAGWEIQNAPRFVAARNSTGDALLLVELVGTGSDPLAAAAAFEQQAGAPLGEPARAMSLGGLPAARGAVAASTGRARVGIELTWIAHGGRIYQIAALSPLARFEELRPGLRRAVDGFRAMTPVERAAITVQRLRVVTAREGETPAELAARVGSASTPAELAVMNDVDIDDAFAGGTLVKVAVTERYGQP